MQICGERKELLARPMAYEIAGEIFVAKKRKLWQEDGAVLVDIENESENFYLRASGRIEFDGFYGVTLELESKRNVETEIKLRIALNEPKYFMGLGVQGGKILESLCFQWDPAVNQDGFWIGDINGGIKIRLRDREYQKPNVNIYYEYKPIYVRREAGITVARAKFCSSGER